MKIFDETLTESLDDFMESYKIVDTEEIYSNGIELVPIFRVKQWYEYNNKDKEIERLKSIIKEVREYVIQEVNNINAITYINILDILDKENK